MPEDAEHRLAAILVADVAGYSRLIADDESATVRTIGAYQDEIELHIRQHSGRLVDFTGDQFLAEFPSALQAVQCARETQRVLNARNAALSAERRLEFRMGIHIGDVRVEGESLFGDGVNVAARLQSLADPGGLCMSAAVREQVVRRLDLQLRDLGRRSLKNIPEPVHAFLLSELPGRGRSGKGRLTAYVIAGSLVALALLLVLSWPLPLGLVLDLAGVARPPENPSLPDKPSIVVLPFANLGGDPAEEYFSDGMTEDLTTDLSRSPHLFVISRNSSFTYKGRAVKVEVVGRELGVRYVLEGSVRKDADRVRVTAQLIDATTGFHVWSERYDRDLTDLFALQAELSERIMAAVGAELHAAELERLRRKPTSSLSAYDTYLRGIGSYVRFTREGHDEARRLFERAIELDPEFAEPRSQLGWIAANRYGNAWSLDPAHVDRALEHVDQALAIDPGLANALVLKGLVLALLGRTQEAHAYAMRGVEADPNWQVSHTILAVVQSLEGDLLGSLRSTQQAVRLNPKLPSLDTSVIAFLNYRAGRTDAAVELWERARAANSDLVHPRFFLAIIAETEGRREAARRLVQEILAINPQIDAEWVGRHPLLASVWGSEERVAAVEGLRRAGLP